MEASFIHAYFPQYHVQHENLGKNNSMAESQKNYFRDIWNEV